MESNNRKYYKIITKTIIFICLISLCYVLYLREAVVDFNNTKTTLTTNKQKIEYLEQPSITICPNPTFKRSVAETLKLDIRTRGLFFQESLARKYLKYFENRTVPQAFFNASYGLDDIEVYLDPGNFGEAVKLLEGTDRVNIMNPK